MIPENEPVRQELDAWSLQGKVGTDILACSRISDSLKTVFHNIGGDFENDEAEEGEEEAV